MSIYEKLEPQRVFYYFEELTKIPHGSRNTKAISDYLYQFGKERNLECYQDELNNIIIIKEATNGYENKDTIIIQGHMDMVCEKNSDCSIDFEKDALDLYVDGDYLRAKGSTLGGDDGIAVAYALAILESDTIKHPRLEVVITVDEEIGMLGAFDMDLSILKGRKMLNIDSDVEGVFLTGCAGGLSLISDIPVKRTVQKGLCYEITVGGLFGGHSGSEIDKERGNANILMGRLFAAISEKTVFGLSEFAGGLKDNAIVRESKATIVIPNDAENELLATINELNTILKNEYILSDPDVVITATALGEKELSIIDYTSLTRVIYFLRQTPNGVVNMSTAMKGLVETSLNLGILKLEDESLHMVTSIRSSISTRKNDVMNRVVLLVEMLGGECEIEGDYPAWEYRIESPLREDISKVYEAQTGKKPEFTAIHAGLECGIFSDKLEGLDCVSFGPENLDIHTPMERLSISSTKRVWDFLIAFLEQ